MALHNPLGNPIPAFTDHAISVSLPEWADNVGYEEGEARVLDAMQTGYPRFFIHANIKKVSSRCDLPVAIMACKISLPSPFSLQHSPYIPLRSSPPS